MASSEVFAALGIPPASGRAFRPEEDTPAAARVALISERLWRGRFNADPAMLGRPLVLNGEPHTVVGIMPPGMRFPSRLTDVWLPLGPLVPTLPVARGVHPGLYAVGKLKPGETFDRAVADMDTIARRLEQQYPDSNRDVAVAMIPYYEQIVQNIRPTLMVLLGAVVCVLLIACANLANLMLARSERRQRDIAVRRALGADRWRIIQQLLTESLLMALAGGALGVLLAYWTVGLFVASRPTTIPRIDLVGVDARVLGFAVVLSVATGIIFGLVPALRASNPDLLSVLKQAGRGSIAGPAGRLRAALVVAEVALALVLLVGAGLMIRSFARLMAIDPGFDPDHVVTMRITLPPAKYRGPRTLGGVPRRSRAEDRGCPRRRGRRAQQRGAARRGRLGIRRHRRGPADTRAGRAGHDVPLSDEHAGLPARDGHSTIERPVLHRARHCRVGARRHRRRDAGAAAVPRRGSAGKADRLRVPGRPQQS